MPNEYDDPRAHAPPLPWLSASDRPLITVIDGDKARITINVAGPILAVVCMPRNQRHYIAAHIDAEGFLLSHATREQTCFHAYHVARYVPLETLREAA